jgi:tRNA A-37 threonylcarbamoyl transferase component Bud32
LAVAGRSPALPLDLQLPTGELQLQQWLRVLPEQRYVACAQWQGRRVLAKLLVGNKAARHFQRELDGARLLAAQGLPTPALLEHGFAEGQGGWLLFDYLDGAQSLWDAWRAVEREPWLSNARQQVLVEALEMIARMHACGLWQADLHLDNLLRQAGQLWIIDGGGVQAQTPAQPLSRQKVLENLGMFFAQLPAEIEAHLEELLVHYLLINPEHALPLELLGKEIARVRQWRLRDYLKKIGRDCSLFSARIGAFGLRIVRRDQAITLQPLLDNPDSFLAGATAACFAAEADRRPVAPAEDTTSALFADESAPTNGGAFCGSGFIRESREPTSQLLKDGGSATVARVELDGRQLLVKRYNLKNFLHRLKRFWRPSRAWHSWREGNRLQHLGIATPLPLAVLESRWCWLRGRAWLVTDYCGGQDILSLSQSWLDTPPPEEWLVALDRLFAALLRERISHGDLKGTNLLWDEQFGCWSLIDLDAMRQFRSERCFARAYARDRARFLRNWPQDSPLYRLLDQRIPKAA